MNYLSSRKTLLAFVTLALLVFLGQSCDNDKMTQNLQAIPTAFGKVNDVVIIADSSLWRSPVGDTIDFYYGSAYPVLPQPEPIFDLRHFSPEALDRTPIMKELRTYIVVANLSDKNSPTTQMVIDDLGEEKLRDDDGDGFGNAVVRDKWAKGQLLIYLYGQSQRELLQGIVKSFPAVAERLREADAPRVDATAFFNGIARGLMDTVRTRLGAEMRIPATYFLAPLEDTSVVWLRKDTPEGTNNLFLTRVPYSGQSVLSLEGIKTIRDSLGYYVSTSLPNTYMKINDRDLPIFTDVTSINGDYALEARGVWEIENDFVGGPFVSYLIYDPNKSDLLFVDGFVHAPGEDKRDRMQELEYLINTIRY